MSDSVTVYRNPLEKAIWENGNDTIIGVFIFGILAVFAFGVISWTLELIGIRKNVDKIAGIITFLLCLGAYIIPKF